MNKIFSNPNGFSLTELMIAIGMSVAIIVPTALVLNRNAHKTITQLENQSTKISDIVQAQSIIVNDLSSSEPSFNFLKVPAHAMENVEVSPGCFNYQRHNFWEKTDQNSCTPLSIVLAKDGDSFIFLKNKQGPSRTPIHFTPDRFFDLTKADTAGSDLFFSSDRFVDFLMKPDVKTKRSACIENDYLKISSLGDFTVLDAGQPRTAQYALILPCVSESSKIKPIDSSFIYNFVKDGCRDKEIYSGVKRVETFFRCMPMAGGLANSLAVPVELIRYKVVVSTNAAKKEVKRLVRERGTLDSGDKFIPTSTLILMGDFQSIVFYREATSQSLIKFKIENSNKM